MDSKAKIANNYDQSASQTTTDHLTCGQRGQQLDDSASQKSNICTINRLQFQMLCPTICPSVRQPQVKTPGAPSCMCIRPCFIDKSQSYPTLVACGWAGAVLEKAPRESGQEQYAQRSQNAKKVKWGSTDRPTDRPTDRRT